MSGEFDPYFKWLSIPPDQQPPNHYRLLGVPDFVDDADVIENAADKQMLMLRTLSTGKHAALAQKLLNEVSAAKLALLDSGQKTVYDAQLKRARAPAPLAAPRTRAAQPAVRSAAPQQAVPLQATSPAAQVAINTDLPEEDIPFWRQPLAMIAIGGSLAALLVVGGFLWALNSDEDETPVAEVVEPAFPDPPQRPVEPKQQPESPPEIQPQPEPEIRPSPEPEAEPPPKADPTTGTTSSQAGRRAVDLLSTIDLEKNTLRGKWVLDQGTLRGVANGSILEIDHLVQIPEYDVVVDVQNTNPTCHLTLGLVSPLKRQFYLAMGYYNSGLGTYEGKPFHANPTTTNLILPHDGKPHTLIYQIRKEGVTLLLDNEQRLQWRGDYSKLTRPQEVKVSSDQVFYVGSQNVAIKKLEFRPLVDAAPTTVVRRSSPFQTVDLLANVDLKKHALTPEMIRSPEFTPKGDELRMENGVLVGSGQGYYGLHFPCELPPEYDLNLIVRRGQGKKNFSIILAYENRPFQFAVTGSGCVLTKVDGLDWTDKRNPTLTNVSLFPDLRPRSMVIQVRHKWINVLFEGRSVLQWPQGYDRLSLNSHISLPSESPLALIMNNSNSKRIEKLELVPFQPDRPTPGTDGPVDLLSTLDLKKNTLKGRWTHDQGALQAAAEPSLVQFDDSVGVAEYDVTVVMKKNIPARHYISMGLVSPEGKLFSAVMTPDRSGLHLLDGKPFHSNAATSSKKLPGDNRPHTLVYQVRKAGLTVLLDGETQWQWQGGYHRLTPDPSYKNVSGRSLILGASSVLIEKIEFRPLGSGRPPANTDPVNLLSKLDIEKDTLLGEWSMKEGKLRNINPQSLLAIDHPVRVAEYDVTMVMKNSRVDLNYVCMGLISPLGTPLTVVVAGNTSGFNMLDGKAFHRNSTTIGRVLPGDVKPHTLVFQVRKTGITVLLDGQTCMKWQGDFLRFKGAFIPSTASKLIDSLKEPLLYLKNDKVVIEKLEFRPLGGGRPPANADPVNLLTNLELKKNTLRGKWKLEQGKLRATIENSFLQLDHPVRFAEYDVTANVKSISPTCYISLGLVGPTGQQFSHVTHWNFSGLHLLDGKRYPDNETTTRGGLPTDDKTHSLVYQVRKDRVTVLLDGKPRLEWIGDPNRLSLDPKFGITDKKILFLGTYNVWIEDLVFEPLVNSDSSVVQTPTAQLPLARQRHPLPTDEQQKASLILIKDVFQKEYAELRTKVQKAELGKTLRTQAGQSRDDLPGRYMLYREARRLATLGGDSSTALRAANSLAREYDVDQIEIVSETIKALTKTVSTTQRKYLVESALRLIDDAVRDNQFDAIKPLIEIALSTARASRDKNLLKKVVDVKKNLAEVNKAYAIAENSLKTIKEKPDDPQANLIAGRFVALVLGDWQHGLPMLAKGSDEKLKSLAEADLANPQEGNDLAVLGDRWSELSASLEDAMQKSAQQRAIDHYRQAQRSLQGLSRALVDKKLKALEKR